MKESIAIPVAHALHDPLSAFRLVEDQPLLAVRYDYLEFEKDDPPGPSVIERIWFDFEHGSLEISAEAADDTIEVAYLPRSSNRTLGSDVSREEPWQPLLGKRFGWGWVIVNQQGYCDGAMLSLGGIYPQMLLTVAASEIQIGTISKRS